MPRRRPVALVLNTFTPMRHCVRGVLAARLTGPVVGVGDPVQPALLHGGLEGAGLGMDHELRTWDPRSGEPGPDMMPVVGS
jgi:hypothetical protein